MKRHYTLEYWIDDDWYVGRLIEVPGIFSQGETLKELEDNVKDAFKLMTEDNSIQPTHPGARTKDIILEVA
jgi:predicted RNase H-like HicB family nuclease